MHEEPDGDERPRPEDESDQIAREIRQERRRRYAAARWQRSRFHGNVGVTRGAEER